MKSENERFTLSNMPRASSWVRWNARLIRASMPVSIPRSSASYSVSTSSIVVPANIPSVRLTVPRVAPMLIVPTGRDDLLTRVTIQTGSPRSSVRKCNRPWQTWYAMFAQYDLPARTLRWNQDLGAPCQSLRLRQNQQPIRVALLRNQSARHGRQLRVRRRPRLGSPEQCSISLAADRLQHQ